MLRAHCEAGLNSALYILKFHIICSGGSYYYLYFTDDNIELREMK